MLKKARCMSIKKRRINRMKLKEKIHTKKEELVNGKLPVNAYIQAKELAKGVGII